MVVETRYGKIEGRTEKGCHVFRGVPYAKAPVGKLRLAKPQKPDPWDGVYQAFQCGNKCWQRKQQPGGFYQIEFYNDPEFSYEMSEDCLYLNIWMPENAPAGERLPVAIYVHGGAYMSGSGSHLPFAAYELAKKGVIIVTINYRVGLWGFMAHPVLAAKNGEKVSGNYGLWDQIEALKWVKENIEAFGGDPDNITLFGQSAGAMSLQILCLSPETEGLYHKMIMESGGGYKNPLGAFRPMEIAEKIGGWVFEEAGIDPADPEAGSKLEAIPEAELEDIAERVVGRGFKERVGIPFVPVIDGEILTADGDLLMEQGSYHKVPYILGANKQDILMEQASDFSQDANPMQVSNKKLAAMINENGGDAYVYFFQRELPGDNSGAFHSAELWYVFGSLDYCWRKPQFTGEDYAIAEEMMNCWSDFMKNGKPEHGWEKYDGKEASVKLFG